MIEIKNLRKVFGSVVAVDHMSFVARDGEVTTMLGGNGSGKTTTLRMIGGVVRPTSGQVCVDEIDVAVRRSRALSCIGMLHDEFGLYPRLSAEEHVRYALQLHGFGGRRITSLTHAAIEALELQDIAKRAVHGFSHGQRMKTALARAIAHQPQNLVLDEPTRGLDVFSVRTLRQLIKTLKRKGVCILMSSHVMADVMELSDKIVVVNAGRPIAEGAPGHILKLAGQKDLEEAFIHLVGQDDSRRAA